MVEDTQAPSLALASYRSRGLHHPILPRLPHKANDTRAADSVPPRNIGYRRSGQAVAYDLLSVNV